MRDLYHMVPRNDVAQGPALLQIAHGVRSYGGHSIEISGPSSTPCNAKTAPVFRARLK
ncbi:hypothetical protein GCM10007392_30060 [Saccharospirillum salsuginis]|uniref:Uncharacterized protein n=1 Tax=Saccharospirillum salsuginis TaxID=418750 RepID=A0A918NDW3_9GAMM|nr:hypothetical protein GCM10007392_30060 [Saccharospirillum salsuginis]